MRPIHAISRLPFAEAERQLCAAAAARNVAAKNAAELPHVGI